LWKVPFFCGFGNPPIVFKKAAFYTSNMFVAPNPRPVSVSIHVPLAY